MPFKVHTKQVWLNLLVITYIPAVVDCTTSGEDCAIIISDRDCSTTKLSDVLPGKADKDGVSSMSLVISKASETPRCKGEVDVSSNTDEGSDRLEIPIERRD